MTLWRLLLTPPARGAWNMALDEAILEHIGRGESTPTLRLYAWEPACLSLGHAQPFANVDVNRLQARGWEVVRRITGGRAILHTDELTYSVIAPNDEPIIAGTLLESYNRLAQALLLAVKNLELPVEMQEGKANDNTSPNPVCFEVPSTYEITVDGKKLIGSAQARKKEGVLQHGSLPLSGDLTRICEALVFESESARAEASKRLLARAATVGSALGREVSWEMAAQAFIHAFEAQLGLSRSPHQVLTKRAGLSRSPHQVLMKRAGLSLKRGELSESESKRTDELVKEKYAHAAWTERV